MGIQGAPGGDESQDLTFVKLHCLGGGKVVRQEDDRLLFLNPLLLPALEDGQQAPGDILYVGGAASHISVLTGLELLLQVLRRPGYGIFRVDRQGADDVLNGALEFAVLQHHPVNLEDGRFSLPHLPQGLFMQPVQLL